MKSLKKLSFKYWYIKLGRQAGTPEYVSRGMAAGLFCAFGTPVMQIPAAIALAFIIKGAKIPAFLGTWLTNWFTTPFFLPIQCMIGSLIWGVPLSFAKIKDITNAVIAASDVSWWQSVKVFCSFGSDILASFLIGGVAMGVLVAVPGYFITLWVVRRYRAIRQRMRTEKVLQFRNSSSVISD